MKGVLGHLRDEAEVRADSAQQKYDELLARFIEAEDKLELCKGSDRIAEEHAEYEAVIRRGGGLTISEAEQRVKEIVARCGELGKSGHSTSSREVREQIDELVKIGSLFETVKNRNPRLKRFLARAEPSSTIPPSSSRPMPSTTRVDKFPPEFYQKERELRGRGRGRGRSRGGGRSGSSKKINIDDLLSTDFCDKWLNFSYRPPGSSS